MTSVTLWVSFVALVNDTDAKVLMALFVAIPSTLAAFSGYQSAMARRDAAKQMAKNGGSTMRDAIDRIEKRLTLIEDYITNPKEG